MTNLVVYLQGSHGAFPWQQKLSKFFSRNVSLREQNGGQKGGVD